MTIFFILLSSALTAMTIMTILGSIASRRYNFNYAFINTFTLILYLVISYLGAYFLDTTAGVTLAGLLGLYEATIGWKICLHFKANLGDLEEELKDMMDESNNMDPIAVVVMVLMYLFIGWLGTLMV